MKQKKNIIAHRGIFDNKKIPENSLLAFQKALQCNTSIELDVQLTKDNVLVVFHDFSLKRMTGDYRLLQDCSFKELQELVLLDTDEKIPTLRDVLNLVQGKVLLDIEVKNTKRISDTCDSLKENLQSYSNFILKSFHPGIVKVLKKNFNHVPVGYLMAKAHAYPHSFYYFFLTHPFTLFYCQPDFIAISKELWSKKKFQKFAKKYPIYLWTIQKKEELLDSSIIYICENLPF